MPFGAPRAASQLASDVASASGDLDRHERLVHVVVTLAEVHALRSIGQVRDLLEDEVEVLVTGRERLGERDGDEPDVVVGETETLGHLERHGALETPTEVGIVRLPVGVLRPWSLPPTKVGGPGRRCRR